MTRRTHSDGVRDLVPRFILGVATGLLVGLLIVLSPVVVIVALVGVLIATVGGIAQEHDRLRSMVLAGVLVGIGALLLYGAVSTIAACNGTEDFCGNANPWPLAVLALGTIGVGAIGAVVIAVRDRG